MDIQKAYETFKRTGNMYNAWKAECPDAQDKADTDWCITTLKSVKPLRATYAALADKEKDDPYYQYKKMCAGHKYRIAKYNAQRIINSVSDTLARKILKLRYIDNRSFGEIAYELHYTYSHVQRIHSRTLRNLKTAP